MITSRKQPSRHFIYFLLFILVIALPDFVFELSEKRYADAILKLLTCFSAFLIPLFIFKNRLRLYTLLLLPVFFLVPLLICIIVFFRIQITGTTLLLVINTTAREATGLVRQYLLPLSLSFILSLCLFVVLLRKIPAKISSNRSLMISGCSLLVFLIVPIFESDNMAFKNDYIIKLKGSLAATSPFSILYSAKFVYKQFALMESTKPYRNHFRFDAKQVPYNTKKQVCILVIGETSRADHWGINGYFRNTSPFIDRRQNLISFPNTVSGACETDYAVPQIITCVNADNFDDHYKQKSVVSVFKEVGFTTYWITDQIDYGNIKMHEDEADSVYRLRLALGEGSVTMENTDMQLISYLKKVLDQPGDRKFIVIHTMGSHWDYGQQYTSDFDIFKPSEKTIPAQPSDFSKKTVLVNSYDNSILFTDLVLDSIIRVADKQKAFTSLFYISDHGEDLFDDSFHRFLHGDFEATRFSSHVPFFIWYNDSVRIADRAKIDVLMSHKQNKIGAENVLHTITDFCDVHFPKQDSTKCIDRNSFTDSKQRVLSIGSVVFTYDSLVKMESKAKKGI